MLFNIVKRVRNREMLLRRWRFEKRLMVECGIDCLFGFMGFIGNSF